MRISDVRTTWLAVACAVLLAIPAWAVLQTNQDPQYRTTPQSGTQSQAQPTTSGQTSTALEQETDTTSTANLTLPAGTRMVVRMIDSVNTDVNRPGDRFRGTLDEDLVVSGAVLCPKGSNVFGRVVQFGSTTGSNLGLQNPQGTNTYGSTATGIGSGFSSIGTSVSGTSRAGTSNTGTSVSGSAGTTNPNPGRWQNYNVGTTLSDMSQSAINQSAPNWSAQNQSAANQSAMPQSGVSGITTSQNTTSTQSSSSQTGMQTGQLGLIITEIDVAGRQYMLTSASETTPGAPATGAQRAWDTATTIDFNHGAPATAVISSSPSASPITGLGSGAANQVVINGDHLNVPGQTVLEFRVQEPCLLTPSTGSSMNP